MPGMVPLDLVAAVRHARRRPALALAVIATLACVVGAATTALGLAAAVLWRPLPFADADALVFVWEAQDDGAGRQPSRATSARVVAWREHARDAFTSLSMFAAAGYTFETPAGAVTVRGVRVSANYFDTLGLPAAVGRTFTPDEGTPGRDQVVVLSHEFWQTHLGGRRDVVGQTVRFSGRPFVVVGVMPPVVLPAWPVNPATVTLDADAREFWVPLAETPELAASSRAHVFGVVARLAPRTSLTRAESMLDAATDTTAADPHGALLTPLRGQFVRDARTSLLTLAGAALAMLLVACANLAALFVATFEGRRVEFALRSALGSSWTRLARHVVVEAATLTLAGAALGLVFAHVALGAAPSLLPEHVPLLTPPQLDGRLMVTGLLLGALATAMMVAWPLRRLRAAAPAPRGVPAAARPRVYGVLVASQLAVAMALVVVAALLGQSLWSVRTQDVGATIDHVVVADVGLPAPTPVDPWHVVTAERALLEAVAATPGVQAAALAYDHPLEANWSEAPALSGDVSAAGNRRQAELRIVSPEYFEALGVEVLEGRALMADDDLDRPGAAVVNETFARDAGGHVVGRTLATATPRNWYATAPETFTIVGVVRNERVRGLEEAAPPAFYVSTRQFPQTDVTLLARTDGTTGPSGILSTVRALDRAITVDPPTTLEAILGEQLATRRMTASVIGGLALAALGVAAIGLYGLLAVLVSSRTREIGVRLALGASPAHVAWRVLRDALRSTVAGGAVGLLLALAAGRLVQGLLVDVSPTDIGTLVAVAGALLVVALAAAARPALRAARVDPSTALREG